MKERWDTQDEDSISAPPVLLPVPYRYELAAGQRPRIRSPSIASCLPT